MNLIVLDLNFARLFQATETVIEKRCGGMEVALHLRSLQTTPFAALSRLCVGIRHKTLIINLPGSPKAVKVRSMSLMFLPKIKHRITQGFW